MDLTHIACGVDGWAHLAAVIDCHDREIVGYEFALRGRAKEAEPKCLPTRRLSSTYSSAPHPKSLPSRTKSHTRHRAPLRCADRR
jgi:hypothetical protein